VRSQNNPKSRQTVLFAGMQLLSGQQDLFPTDGTQTQGDEPCSRANSSDSAASGNASSIAADGG
jgi:hypothetical protein